MIKGNRRSYTHTTPKYINTLVLQMNYLPPHRLVYEWRVIGGIDGELIRNKNGECGTINLIIIDHKIQVLKLVLCILIMVTLNIYVIRVM